MGARVVGEGSVLEEELGFINSPADIPGFPRFDAMHTKQEPIWKEMLTRVRVTEEGADRQKNFGDRQSGAPLLLQDV